MFAVHQGKGPGLEALARGRRTCLRCLCVEKMKDRIEEADSIYFALFFSDPSVSYPQTSMVQG
jgi:hypothetical protein